MIKILGLVLIVLCGTCTGFALSSNLSGRVRMLEDTIGMLRCILEELRYTLAPMNRLIGSVASMERYQKLNFLQSCHVLMRRGVPFPQAWRQSLSENAAPLTKEEAGILASLSQVLGAADAGAQEAAVSHTVLLLEDRLRTAREGRDSHSRMYRALGFLGGLALAVALF